MRGCWLVFVRPFGRSFVNLLDGWVGSSGWFCWLDGEVLLLLFPAGSESRGSSRDALKATDKSICLYFARHVMVLLHAVLSFP